MKTAFDTTLLRSFPIEDALQHISNAGYRHIEIGLAHFSLAESSGEEGRTLAKMCSRYNLGIAAVIGNYPLSYPDEEIRAFAVQQYLKAIDMASALECKLFASELNGDIE